jgi:multidrug efflux pump subunit AcrB
LFARIDIGVPPIVLKNGDTSILSIVSNVKKTLPLILSGLPETLHIKPIFDQSVFVRAAVREATIATGLTGMMILLFLGNVRGTMIVCVSIPLAILNSIVIVNALNKTINVMTLDGLALAVGTLVV